MVIRALRTCELDRTLFFQGCLDKACAQTVVLGLAYEGQVVLATKHQQGQYDC